MGLFLFGITDVDTGINATIVTTLGSIIDCIRVLYHDHIIHHIPNPSTHISSHSSIQQYRLL